MIISSYYKIDFLRFNLVISIIQVFINIYIFLSIILIDFLSNISFIKVLLDFDTFLNFIHEKLMIILSFLIQFYAFIYIMIMNESKLHHINYIIILEFIFIDI